MQRKRYILHQPGSHNLVMHLLLQNCFILETLLLKLGGKELHKSRLIYLCNTLILLHSNKVSAMQLQLLLWVEWRKTIAQRQEKNRNPSMIRIYITKSTWHQQTASLTKRYRPTIIFLKRTKLFSTRASLFDVASSKTPFFPHWNFFMYLFELK